VVRGGVAPASLVVSASATIAPVSVIQSLRRSGSLERPVGVAIGVAAVVALAGGLALVGHWSAGLGLLVFAAATMVCLRWPTVSLVAFLLAAYLPDALINAAARPATGVLQGQNSGTWGQPFAGLQVSDVVLLAMAVATFLLVLRRYRQRDDASPTMRLTMWLPVALLGLWLLAEVARNVERFGIAAPGEFRFQYLQLAVVPYLCVVARDRAVQRRAFWTMIVGTLVVPLALVPVIGAIKGWSIGPYSRFFPASASLGIFFALGALVLAKARRSITTPVWAIAAVTCAAGVLMFLDGHRSVWMAAAAAVATALLIGALPRRSVRTLGVPVVAALCVSVAVSWVALAELPVPSATSASVAPISSVSPAPSPSSAGAPSASGGSSTGESAVGYVRTRSTAFVDPAADADSSWRLAVWHAALRQIERSPIVGVGFGGYWRFVVPRSISPIPITVQPHDVYLQTWLKTGAVGLVLYLGSVAGALVFMVRSWRRSRRSGDPTTTVMLATGLVVLVSASLFMVVYSFTYAALLWVGLGLAAAATPPSGDRPAAD